MFTVPSLIICPIVQFKFHDMGNAFTEWGNYLNNALVKQTSRNANLNYFFNTHTNISKVTYIYVGERPHWG